MKVTTCDDVHTCQSTTGEPASQDIKRAETSKLKFLLEAVPKHMIVDSKTTTKAIIDIVKQKYGQDIALRQAQKVKAMLCPRTKQRCEQCGQVHARTMSCYPNSVGHSESQRSLESAQLESNSGADIDFNEDYPPQPNEVSLRNDPTPGRTSTTAPLYENRRLLPPPPTSGLGASANSQQLSSMIDPALTANLHVPSTLQPPPQNQSNKLTVSSQINLTGRTTASATGQQAPRTVQETRLEAARLMQNAARLMQEAARLNAEAARLTASVAHV